MARIEQINYDKESFEVKAAHDAHIKNVGKMTNMKRTLLRNVPTFEVLMEWYTMKDEAQKFLDDIDIYFFCYAISTENDCAICSLFFVKLLAENGIDIKDFEMNPKQQVISDFGAAIGNDPKRIPPELFDRLKGHFTDEQIVVLTGFAAMMVATNLINHVLEVEVDSEYSGMAWK